MSSVEVDGLAYLSASAHKLLLAIRNSIYHWASASVNIGNTEQMSYVEWTLWLRELGLATEFTNLTTHEVFNHFDFDQRGHIRLSVVQQYVVEQLTVRERVDTRISLLQREVCTADQLLERHLKRLVLHPSLQQQEYFATPGKHLPPLEPVIAKQAGLGAGPPPLQEHAPNNGAAREEYYQHSSTWSWFLDTYLVPSSTRRNASISMQEPDQDPLPNSLAEGYNSTNSVSNINSPCTQEDLTQNDLASWENACRTTMMKHGRHMKEAFRGCNDLKPLKLTSDHFRVSHSTLEYLAMEREKQGGSVEWVPFEQPEGAAHSASKKRRKMLAAALGSKAFKSGAVEHFIDPLLVLEAYQIQMKKRQTKYKCPLKGVFKPSAKLQPSSTEEDRKIADASNAERWQMLQGSFKKQGEHDSARQDGEAWMAILELDGVTVEMAREALRMKVHASEGRLNLEEMEAEFSWAQDVFRKFDHNDNGSMETLELGELLKDLSDGQISEDDIESAMQMLDADNSMTVEEGEFMAWFVRWWRT